MGKFLLITACLLLIAAHCSSASIGAGFEVIPATGRCIPILETTLNVKPGSLCTCAVRPPQSIWEWLRPHAHQFDWVCVFVKVEIRTTSASSGSSGSTTSNPAGSPSPSPIG